MRLNCLTGSGRPTAISAEGALPTTLSALGGLPARILSSKDAQASLVASWATPSKAGRASKVCSRESKVTIVGLF